MCDMASRMLSPAKIFPKRRKLSETGRNKIEMISSQPTRKKTTIINILRTPEVSPFGPNKCIRNPDTIRLKRPNKPESKENNRHGRGHIEIGVGPPEQGAINAKNAARRIDMSPTHGPDSWNQSRPVGKQDKNENGGKKPEGFLYQLMSDD